MKSGNQLWTTALTPSRCLFQHNPVCTKKHIEKVRLFNNKETVCFLQCDWRVLASDPSPHWTLMDNIWKYNSDQTKATYYTSIHLYCITEHEDRTRCWRSDTESEVKLLLIKRLKFSWLVSSILAPAGRCRNYIWLQRASFLQPFKPWWLTFFSICNISIVNIYLYWIAVAIKYTFGVSLRLQVILFLS